MERPLRLISADTIVGTPIDALARTIEALLVVASQPLSVDDLAAATADNSERVETALGLLRERFAEGRSGIVLERVAGGFAFRASRESAEACGRLFERPVERGLSQAALETLAIVAYMGPVSRPEIARVRGVAADSAVASLVEREDPEVLVVRSTKVTAPTLEAGKRLTLVVRAGAGVDNIDVAAARGVRLTEVESYLEGDIDLNGALGTDPENHRNGFERIRMTFRVKGDASPEKLREVLTRAHGRSAVFDSITQGVPVHVDLVTD